MRFLIIFAAKAHCFFYDLFFGDKEGNRLLRQNGIKMPYLLMSKDYIHYKNCSSKINASVNFKYHDVQTKSKKYEEIWGFNNNESVLALYVFSNFLADMNFLVENCPSNPLAMGAIPYDVVRGDIRRRVIQWKIFSKLEHKRLLNKNLTPECFGDKWYNGLLNTVVVYLNDGGNSILASEFVNVAQEEGIELSEKLDKKWEKLFRNISVDEITICENSNHMKNKANSGEMKNNLIFKTASANYEFRATYAYK